VCVRACVCGNARKRERERGKQRERERERDESEKLGVPLSVVNNSYGHSLITEASNACLSRPGLIELPAAWLVV
jgi:hypothetical protein